jgi:hypothetical protein
VPSHDSHSSGQRQCGQASEGLHAVSERCSALHKGGTSAYRVGASNVMLHSEASLCSIIGGRGTYLFLFLVWAKVVVLGAWVAKTNGDTRSHRFLPLCVALSRRRE